MAYYTIETDHLDPSLRLDPGLDSLVVEEVPFHNFEHELHIIGEHADLVQKEEKIIEDFDGVKMNEETAAETGADAEVAVDADEVDACIEAKTQAQAQPIENEDEKIDAHKDDSDTQAIARSPLNVGASSGGAGSAENDTPNVGAEEGIPDSASAANGGLGVKAVPATPVTGAAVVPAVAMHARVVPETGSGEFVGASPSPPSLGVSAGEEEAIAAVGAVISTGEEERVDPAYRKILDNDSKVSAMCERTNLSRSDCFFYLESADHDLDKAVALFESLVMQ